jgi:hypothetical protein
MVPGAAGSATTHALAAAHDRDLVEGSCAELPGGATIYVMDQSTDSATQ